MRFRYLNFLRYGSLTDRRLVLDPDARLHIVYGPNEAGKSSALSAITDLLFGFPTAARYSFQHDPATLRVGAMIESRAGVQLEFRRRRGKKSTLLGAAEPEEALPDDALVPFLGTLGRDVFERAFGLNSATLRAGGENMLKSSGEIGSLLFSAASGLTGLADLRKQLEAEADAIYAPRRSKDRLFYQTLDSHEEARKAERENELKSGDWKKLIAEQDALNAELDTLQVERQDKKRRLDQLRLLQRLDPIIREIDRVQDQLVRYEGLGDLPSDFQASLASLLERSQENEQALRHAKADKNRLKEDIAAISVDDPLLASSSTIMAAHADKGAYKKASEDLVRVRSELEDFEQKLAQSARRLGLTSIEDVVSRQPSDADLQRLRTLLDEGAELDREIREVRQRILEQQDGLRQLATSAQGERLGDPKAWSEQLATLQPELNELLGMEALQVKLGRAEADLATAVARLDPPANDIRVLSTLPLPDVSELANHRRLIDDARAHSKSISAHVAAIEEEIAKVLHELAALEGAGHIISRDDLLASRVARDSFLQSVQKQPDASGFEQLMTAIGAADTLADALLADAERVSRHAQLSLRRAELEQSLAVARRDASHAQASLSAATNDYQERFIITGVSPSTPDRMIEWRRAVEEIFRQLREIDELADGLKKLDLKDQKIRPALLHLAKGIGLAADALPTIAVGRGLDRKLAEIAQEWMDSRAGETKRALAQEALIRLEDRERGLLDAISRWQSTFSSALVVVGLSEDADSGMAGAALEAWRTVPDLLTQHENRKRRVDGMARDMEVFEENADRLVAAVAPDLADIQSDVAIGLLHERMLNATAQDKQRAAHCAELERIELLLKRLTLTAEELSSEVTSIAGKLSKEPEELNQVLEDLREKIRLEDGLRLCRERFIEQADDASEDEMRAALSAFDRVTTALEIETLVAEEDRLLEQMNSVRIAQADNDRRRRGLETGMGAERAVFNKRVAEAEAQDLARRWVVLKLAANLLSSSMDAYRERQADPVMQRAGDLFSGLTGGRFQRLVQIYDDRDELQLAVERKTGEQVPLSGLSEGTGDQLYLALRLAFLEDYCRRNEPAPLVLDDIFQTFDDERTAAGLRTLVGAGETHQTLLFTHQTSVVDMARSELGNLVNVVSL